MKPLLRRISLTLLLLNGMFSNEQVIANNKATPHLKACQQFAQQITIPSSSASSSEFSQQITQAVQCTSLFMRHEQLNTAGQFLQHYLEKIQPHLTQCQAQDNCQPTLQQYLPVLYIRQYNLYNIAATQAKLTGNTQQSQPLFKQSLMALNKALQLTSHHDTALLSIFKNHLLIELASIDELNNDLANMNNKTQQVKNSIDHLIAQSTEKLDDPTIILITTFALFYLQHQQYTQAETLLQHTLPKTPDNSTNRYLINDLLGQTYYGFWQQTKQEPDWLTAEQHFKNNQLITQSNQFTALNRLTSQITIASFYVDSEKSENIQHGIQLLKDSLKQLKLHNKSHRVITPNTALEQSIQQALQLNTTTKLAEAYIKQAQYAAAKQPLYDLLKTPSSFLAGMKGSKTYSLQLLAEISSYEDDYAKALQYIQQAYQTFTTDTALSNEQAQALQQLAQTHLAILQRGIAKQHLTTTTIMPEAFIAMQRAQGIQRMHSLERLVLKRTAPELQPLLTRLWQAQTQLHWQDQQQTNQLTQTPSNPARNPALINGKTANISLNLLQEIQTLHQTLKQNSPEYSQYLAPEPLTLTQAQGLLKPHEALLLWAVGHDNAFLMVVPYQQAPQFISLNTDQLQLAKVLNRTQPHGFLQTLTDPTQLFDTQTAYALYQTIFAPAESALTNTTHLLLVPDNSTQDVPFPALLRSPAPANTPDRAPEYAELAWFINRYAISYLPSARALADFQRTSTPTIAKPSSTTFVGFANPVLYAGEQETNTVLLFSQMLMDMQDTSPTDSPYLKRPSLLATHLTPLPETATEVKHIAQLLPQSTTALFLQAQATETQLKILNQIGQLQQANLLMFATHALLPADSPTNQAFYALEPALVLTPPPQGSANDDGYLTASEIARLNLHAEWVILSACKTGTITARDASTGLSQLAQAFFMAGARSVLAAQWNIRSQATTRFMTQLFEHLQHTPHRAKALQYTMQTMSHQPSQCGLWCLLGGEKPSNPAHPALWAGFTIYGAGDELPTLMNTTAPFNADDNSGIANGTVQIRH